MMQTATVTLLDTVLDAPAERLRVTVRGAVQGVGFRPFIYRLAAELGLAGWVNNSSQGVLIEVEGAPELLRQFLLRIEAERPPRSFIQSLEAALLDPVGYTAFTIRHSDPSGPKTAVDTIVPPYREHTMLLAHSERRKPSAGERPGNRSLLAASRRSALTWCDGRRKGWRGNPHQPFSFRPDAVVG